MFTRLTIVGIMVRDQDEELRFYVEISFEPLPTGGTSMLLTHDPYSDSVEDQQMRVDQHLAGWQHFIPKLQEVVS